MQVKIQHINKMKGNVNWKTTYRYCGSIFAHTSSKYNPEVISTGKDNPYECTYGRNYFHLNVNYRYLWKGVK